MGSDWRKSGSASEKRRSDADRRKSEPAWESEDQMQTGGSPCLLMEEL